MTDLEKKNNWLNCPAMTAELVNELTGMDDEALHDSFYRNLTFGTGGLRGVLGAGTNRMNLFTVAKATRGLGKYLKETVAFLQVVHTAEILQQFLVHGRAGKPGIVFFIQVHHTILP